LAHLFIRSATLDAKKQAKSREKKGLAFLDESLEHEKRRREYNENVAKIKQKQSEYDEERLTQAESLAKESLSLFPKNRKAIQNAIDGVDEALEGLAGGCDKLATALDTSQSKILGSRATLGRAHLTNQWLSTQDAVDELNIILMRFESNESFGNKHFKTEAISLIRNAIQSDNWCRSCRMDNLLSYVENTAWHNFLVNCLNGSIASHVNLFTTETPMS
jgi:chromosome segregation ATPase